MSNLSLKEIALLHPSNTIDAYVDASDFEVRTRSLTVRQMNDQILAFEYPNHLSHFMTTVYRSLKNYSDDLVLDDSDIYVPGSFAQKQINPNFRSQDYASIKTQRMFASGYWIPFDFETEPVVDIVSVKAGGNLLRTPEDWIALRTDKRYAFTSFNKFYLLIRPDLNISEVQVTYIVAKDLAKYEQKLKATAPIGFGVSLKVKIPAFIWLVTNAPTLINVNLVNDRLTYVDKIDLQTLKDITGQRVEQFMVVFRTLAMGRRILIGSTISKSQFVRYLGRSDIVRFAVAQPYIE